MNKPVIGLIFATAAFALVMFLRSGKEDRPSPAGKTAALQEAKPADRQSTEAVLSISPQVASATGWSSNCVAPVSAAKGAKR